MGPKTGMNSLPLTKPRSKRCTHMADGRSGSSATAAPARYVPGSGGACWRVPQLVQDVKGVAEVGSHHHPNHCGDAHIPQHFVSTRGSGQALGSRLGTQCASVCLSVRNQPSDGEHNKPSASTVCGVYWLWHAVYNFASGRVGTRAALCCAVLCPIL